MHESKSTTIIDIPDDVILKILGHCPPSNRRLMSKAIRRTFDEAVTFVHVKCPPCFLAVTLSRLPNRGCPPGILAGLMAKCHNAVAVHFDEFTLRNPPQLAGMENVRKLDFRGEAFGPNYNYKLDLTCLSGLRSLDSLLLASYKKELCQAANFHGLPTSLTNLTFVRINAVTPIVHISHLVSLRALKVADDDTCDWHVALRNMTQLDRLELDHVKWGDGLSATLRLPALAQLTNLRINNTALDAAALVGLTALTKLTLWQCLLTGYLPGQGDPTMGASLASLVKLVHLDVSEYSHNWFLDAAALTSLSTLTFLDIRDVACVDGSVAQLLARLSRLPSLKKLGYANDNFDDDEAARAARGRLLETRGIRRI